MDSPIFGIFVLVLFGKYFISTQMNNRLSTDGYFALVWTEKIESYLKINGKKFLDKRNLTIFGAPYFLQRIVSSDKRTMMGGKNVGLFFFAIICFSSLIM